MIKNITQNKNQAKQFKPSEPVTLKRLYTILIGSLLDRINAKAKKTSRTGGKKLFLSSETFAFRKLKKRDKLLRSKTKRLLKDFDTIYPDLELDVEFAWTGNFARMENAISNVGQYGNSDRDFFRDPKSNRRIFGKRTTGFISDFIRRGYRKQYHLHANS